MVSWEAICKPYCYGGLGVKNLRLQGLALRLWWEWLRRTAPDRPWQGLPCLKDSEAKMVFDGLIEISVGNRRSTKFWTDRWMDGSRIPPRICYSQWPQGARTRGLLRRGSWTTTGLRMWEGRLASCCSCGSKLERCSETRSRRTVSDGHGQHQQGFTRRVPLTVCYAMGRRDLLWQRLSGDARRL